jgi:hypothetical protein
MPKGNPGQTKEFLPNYRTIDLKKKIFRRWIDEQSHTGDIPPKERPISLARKLPMCDFRFTISAASRTEVECHLQTAQPLGHLRRAKDGLAILAVSEGQSFAPVALGLRVPEKTVATWMREFCC